MIWGHAVKAVKKYVSKVSKGAKFSEGLSWSQQLAAKVEPIATHISWSVRNCGAQSIAVRACLLLCLEHPKWLATSI
jgi:hypothetical protein